MSYVPRTGGVTPVTSKRVDIYPEYLQHITLLFITVHQPSSFKMSIQTFAEVADFSAVLRLADKLAIGNTLFFEAMPGHSNLYTGPAMRQSYNVKPQGFQASVKAGDKFEINLQTSTPECRPFEEACGRLDDFVKSAVFARKAELLPAKDSVIKSADSLDLLFSSGHLIKAGTKDKNGGKYADNLRLRIVGDWAEFVSGVSTRVVNMKGTDKTVVDACEWSPRTKALKPTETKFYLWLRTNEAGKDVYADRIIDAVTGVSRLVGPQDCVVGSTITPLFAVSHMYFNEGMGITAVARALYIKPAAEPESAGGEFSATTTSSVPLLGGIELESAPAGAGSKRGREDETEDGAGSSALKTRR